jgi:hypothetical protein
VAQHNHAAFKVARAHVPCEYTVRRCIRGSHRQDLDLPTHRQRTRDDLRASFRVQSTQVPDRDERAVGADAVDDKSCAARAELPLAGEVVAHDYVRFMQLNAAQRTYATANSHNHVGQEEGGTGQLSLAESKKGDDLTCWLSSP